MFLILTLFFLFVCFLYDANLGPRDLIFDMHTTLMDLFVQVLTFELLKVDFIFGMYTPLKKKSL